MPTSSDRRSEIWGKSYIPALAKTAMEQTEKRLVDYLEIRRALEAKIAALFGVYISITLAVFSLSGFLATRSPLSGLTAPVPGWAAGWLFLSGGIFLSGALALGAGLKPSTGAILGGTAEFWLNPDAEIDRNDRDDDAQAARHYAIAALDFHDRFAAQVEDNAHKQQLLTRALYAGLAGAAVFGCVLLVLVFSAR